MLGLPSVRPWKACKRMGRGRSHSVRPGIEDLAGLRIALSCKLVDRCGVGPADARQQAQDTGVMQCTA